MTIHSDFRNVARYRAVADFIYQTFSEHRHCFIA
jgi:hypothetical protein